MAKNTSDEIPHDATETEVAAHEALSAADTVPTGLSAAEDRLAETDEDVTQMWTAKGPKHGRIEQIGAFLHSGQVVIALAYKSGKYKLFREAE